MSDEAAAAAAAAAPEESVTTHFTAKVIPKNSVKNVENNPLPNESIDKVAGGFIPQRKNLKTISSSIGTAAAAAAVAASPSRVTTAGGGVSHIPMAKTTRTFELRRKAGEERAKERAALERAEKLNAIPLPPEKPSAAPSAAAIERRKPLAARKSPNVNVTARKFIAANTKRPAAGNAMRRLHDILYPQERTPALMKSVEVQTVSSEMNDSALVIGDAKVMSPSPKLWADILKKREQDLKEAMLKEVRQVPEHSKDEVNYQSNLKEFLETGTVKRYERKTKRGEERKDVFKRAAEKPKTRPEMDLKKRLKTIEGELLNVFKPRT